MNYFVLYGSIFCIYVANQSPNKRYNRQVFNMQAWETANWQWTTGHNQAKDKTRTWYKRFGRQYKRRRKSQESWAARSGKAWKSNQIQGRILSENFPRIWRKKEDRNRDTIKVTGISTINVFLFFCTDLILADCMC